MGSPQTKFYKKKLCEAITLQNASRTLYNAIGAVIVAFFSFVGLSSCDNDIVWMGFSFIIIGAAFYIMFYSNCYLSGAVSLNALDNAGKIFWWLFILGAVPYLYNDALNSMPINALLISFMFTFPVFSFRQSTCFYAVLAILNTVISLYAGTQIMYSLICLFIFAACYILSLKSHSYTFNLIFEYGKKAKADIMTGLLNRYGGYEVADDLLKNMGVDGKGCACVMADIDFFKVYNDSFGHGAGDEVLTKVGTVFKDCFSSVTDVIFRYGGEEFVVIMPFLNEGAVDIKVKQLFNEISAIDGVAGGQKITISAGVVICSFRSRLIHTPTANTLIAQADGNLYEAKRFGRNKAIYSRFDEEQYGGC